jgi:hypothetical protein
VASEQHVGGNAVNRRPSARPLANHRHCGSGSIRAVHPFPPALISPFALFENSLLQAEVFGLRLPRRSIKPFLSIASHAFRLLHMLPVNSFCVFPCFPRQSCCGLGIRFRAGRDGAQQERSGGEKNEGDFG